ncbi:MAG: DUF362 domain-containing protein [Lentisphaeria bacterium]|nr:DUF362 domain-containing protein [Lentisphaeria bacterium]
MQRRQALKALAGGSAAIVAGPHLLLGRKASAQDAPAALPDLVAVRNGEPAAMVDKALEALGGIGRFVPKGASVVVKPNIGWAREPETGADTNPELVKRIVELCLNAGAAKVYVFDHSVSPGRACYEKSGIEAAAKAAGAIVVPGDDPKHYQKVEIPNAKTLATVDVHELVLGSDVLINVPVLKHHMGSKATVAMKNLMGVVWDRRAYHKQGLHPCIAEFCLFCKPALNIVDAYRVTVANGPQRARPEDVQTQKMLLASTDIVAVDAAAVRVLGTTPQEANHIAMAADLKIGRLDLDNLDIRRVAL